MNRYWTKISDNPLNQKAIGCSGKSSLILLKWLCEKLDAKRFSRNGFHERIFRHGTFAGHDYNGSSITGNRYMGHPFQDHSYYFKTDNDVIGMPKIYFVTQPYLSDEECMDLWRQYLLEEERIINYIPVNKNYKRPELDCLILGKDKSFYYPNHTNLVIISHAEDIKELKGRL